MRRIVLLTLMGVALGAIGGYFYWVYFGCTTGCAITSSPVNSSLYGAFMGGLLFNSFKRHKEEEKHEE
ncbi:MAG TPA: hypothetical protein PKJ19_09240 [Flavobacteriales bacterium]|nr:hypothetical protein [Flavobacteriales bacterium]HNU58006.1 hypothetical protein [Flavobacteriales bacterium]